MPRTEADPIERTPMERLFRGGIVVGLGGLAVIVLNEVASDLIHTPGVIKQGIKGLGAIALFTGAGATYAGRTEGER